MSDSLGRHINECDLCNLCETECCPQCKGKGYVVEDLDERVKGIRRGDILLVKYRFDPVGWIIRRFTHCQYNHVAWALNDHELIELRAKGRVITPLKKYLNKSFYKCKLVRIKDIDNYKLNKALERASKTIFDYPYSNAIINFILVKLQITKKQFRLSCSGFIAYFLKTEANFYFNGKRTFFITPADIEKSKKVEDVSNELCNFNTSI